MNRIVDHVARTLNPDPAEVRLRNFVQRQEFPYDVGLLYRDERPPCPCQHAVDIEGVVTGAVHSLVEHFRPCPAWPARSSAR